MKIEFATLSEASKALQAAKEAEKIALEKVRKSIDAYNEASAALRRADGAMQRSRFERAAKQGELREVENAYWVAVNNEAKRIRRNAGLPEDIGSTLGPETFGKRG